MPFDPTVIDFSSWTDTEERDWLKDLADTLTRLDEWSEFETEPDGPVSTCPVALRVYSELSYKGHSGSTFAWCYCYMKMIVRLGWETFMKERQEASDAMTEEEREKERQILASWAASKAEVERLMAAAAWEKRQDTVEE